MENKTITMPLTEYNQLNDDIKLWKRLFNEAKSEKQEVIDAKAIFITDKTIWANGGIPQARTDAPSLITLNGIYISVS